MLSYLFLKLKTFSRQNIFQDHSLFKYYSHEMNESISKMRRYVQGGPENENDWWEGGSDENSENTD